MIEIQNLTVSYGKTLVLSDLFFTMPKGSLVSVIGTNGSGKSTLLKATLGIIKHQSGDVLIDDVSTATLAQGNIAKRIAYLAQGKSVPDMTVGQMILHGRFPHLGYPRRYSGKDRRIADDVLKRTGLAEYKDLPMSSLSGGMRQSAYIAMALVQDTDYIFLDEPTSYLDITHQIGLMQTLRSLSDSGKGIVAVTHDLPLAFSFSDKIAVLSDGRIIICDTPQSVCSSSIINDIFGVNLKYDANSKNYCYNYNT